MTPERAGQILAALAVVNLAAYLVGPVAPEQLSCVRS